MSYSSEVLADLPALYCRLGDSDYGRVTATTASSSFFSEPASGAIDKNAATNWTTNGSVSGWLRLQRSAAGAVTEYRITRRDDIPARNPQDWTFEGSNDGTTFIVLDTRTGITWPTPGQVKSFTPTITGSYLYYRLNITANNGDFSYTSVAEIALLPETPATGNMADASINSRIGSYYNTVTRGVASLIASNPGNTAAYFNSAGSGYASVPYSSGWMNPASFTLEAVVKTTAAGYQSILDRDGSARVWQFRLNGGNLEFVRIAGGSATVATTGLNINDGNPHHLAATYDGVNLVLYVDGAARASAAMTGSMSGATDFEIGRNNSSGGGAQYFLGTIDEVAYYPTALAPARITTHYVVAALGIVSPYVSSVIADAPWGAWLPSQLTFDPYLDNTGSGTTKFLSWPGVSLSEAALDGGAGAAQNNGVGPIAYSVEATSLTGSAQSVTFLVKVTAGNMQGTFVKLGRGASGDGWGVGVGGTTLDNAGRQLVCLAEGVAWLPTGWSFPSTGTYRVHVTRSGSNYVAYVDGVQVWSGSSSTNNPLGMVGVGGYFNYYFSENYTVPADTFRVLSSGVVMDDVALFSSALTGARVSAQYATPATEIDADAPVFHLPLGDAIDTITDVSGNTRHLYAVKGKIAGPLVTAIAGANGVDFPASYGFLRTNKDASGQPNTVTYEAFVRLAAYPAADSTVVVSGSGGGSSDGPTSSMYVTPSGKVRLALYPHGTGYIESPNPLALNTWHHVVCSVGAAGAKIRINKVTVASDSTTSVNSYTAGFVYVRYGGPFSGQDGTADIDIAGVAVWRSQLSNARTDAHLDAAAGNPPWYPGRATQEAKVGVVPTVFLTGVPTAILVNGVKWNGSVAALIRKMAWWDGSSPLDVTVKWWDGTTEQQATLEGWWDGATVQAVGAV